MRVRATHQHDLVDLAGVELGVLERLLAPAPWQRSKRSLAQLLELGAGEGELRGAWGRSASAVMNGRLIVGLDRRWRARSWPSPPPP
jgi:hypothetical protein